MDGERIAKLADRMRAGKLRCHIPVQPAGSDVHESIEGGCRLWATGQLGRNRTWAQILLGHRDDGVTVKEGGGDAAAECGGEGHG